MSAITRILAELFVMGPQAKDLDHVFFLKNLIDEAMLDVYPKFGSWMLRIAV